MELEAAVVELLVLRTRLLEENEGKDTPATEALQLAATTISDSLNLTRKKEALSPTMAFVAERCELRPGATVEVGRLYREWCEWCFLHLRPAGAIAMFGRNLSAAYPEITVTRPRDEGTRKNHYLGIALRRIGP